MNTPSRKGRSLLRTYNKVCKLLVLTKLTHFIFLTEIYMFGSLFIPRLEDR